MLTALIIAREHHYGLSDLKRRVSELGMRPMVYTFRQRYDIFKTHTAVASVPADMNAQRLKKMHTTEHVRPVAQGIATACVVPDIAFIACDAHPDAYFIAGFLRARACPVFLLTDGADLTPASFLCTEAVTSIDEAFRLLNHKAPTEAQKG